MIRTRFVLVIMIGTGGLFLAAMHGNLNIAIVAMVNHTAISEAIPGSNQCTRPTGNATIPKIPPKNGKYLWDPASQGIILGAITYGSLCTILFGGVLSEKFGPKWVITIGAFLACVFCSLIPTAADLGVAFMVLARFFQGSAQGVITPGCYTLIARWAPLQERSTIITITTVGSILGGTISAIAAGALSATDFMGGWPSVFYLPPIGVGIWLVLWSILVYNKPEEHPRISMEESHFIKNSLRSQNLTQPSRTIPWSAIFKSVPFWALLVMRFAHMWALTTIQTALPLYMDSVLGLGIRENGAVNGILHLMSLFGIVFGGITDILRRKTKWSITCIRKLFCFIAYVGCATCWIAIPFVGCNVPVLITLFFLSKLFIAVSIAGDSVVIMDMAPSFAGTLFGATGTIANTAGFLSPMYTGFITDNDMSINQWRYVFFTGAAIYLVCLLFFMLCGSASIQPWAKATLEEKTNLVTSEEKTSDYGCLTASFKSPELCKILTRSTEEPEL